MPAPTDADGRTVRSQRTREAVTSALVDLLREGGPRPSAGDVAARAGVSVRTIYGHFATMADLEAAVAERVTATIVSFLSPIDPDQPLAARVDLLCGQRARINEELGAVLQVADLRRAESPGLAEARDVGHVASRQQIDRIFDAELQGLGADSRRRRVAAVDALLQPSAWILLRSTHDLPVDQARVAVGEAVLTLLAPPA